jgi:hypothetical protein
MTGLMGLFATFVDRQTVFPTICPTRRTEIFQRLYNAGPTGQQPAITLYTSHLPPRAFAQ